MTKFVVAFGFLALNFYIYHFIARDAVIPPRATFESFPLELGEWACPERQEMTERVVNNLGVTDYLVCEYWRERPRQLVGLYVGYHQTQVREAGGGNSTLIHPPAHCLPGSGWDMIKTETVELDLPGLPQSPGPVNRLIIAKGDSRQLVYYWYQSRGRVIEAGWKKILFVGWDRATRGRTDGALVRFTTPITRRETGEEDAEQAFRDLAPRVVALLPEYLPE
jgi:EpsI family protein